MDNSIYYELQNENIRLQAENSHLKKELENIKTKNLQQDNKVWVLFPVWVNHLFHGDWFLTDQYNYFTEQDGVTIVYENVSINTREWNRKFEGVPSKFVFSNYKEASELQKKLKEESKSKNYDEWWDYVRIIYNYIY